MYMYFSSILGFRLRLLLGFVWFIVICENLKRTFWGRRVKIQSMISVPLYVRHVDVFCGLTQTFFLLTTPSIKLQSGSEFVL